MKVISTITKTTNFKYSAVYNEIKDKKPIGPKTIEWAVSLTSKEEKEAFLLIAHSAIQQIKTDAYTTLIEKRHPGANVWLKCPIPDEDHRKAMLLFLDKICSDILIDLKQ